MSSVVVIIWALHFNLFYALRGLVASKRQIGPNTTQSHDKRCMASMLYGAVAATTAAKSRSWLQHSKRVLQILSLGLSSALIYGGITSMVRLLASVVLQLILESVVSSLWFKTCTSLPPPLLSCTKGLPALAAAHPDGSQAPNTDQSHSSSSLSLAEFRKWLFKIIYSFIFTDMAVSWMHLS